MTMRQNVAVAIGGKKGRHKLPTPSVHVHLSAVNIVI